MRIYIYIVPIDDGAAPNPYGNICTLNLCKPEIRKNALIGDWVIGLGSKDYFGKNLDNHLIYAMKITNKLTMKEYDNYTTKYLQIKIPNINSKDMTKHMGDSVYEFDENGNILLRKSVHSRCTKDEDLAGVYTLLSNNFFYFGKNALKLPNEFIDLASKNNDYKILDEENCSKILAWLNSQNLTQNKIYGEPNRLGIIKPTDKINEKSCCIRKKDIRKFQAMIK